jgi:acyl-CoA thioester hydrolase
VSATFIFNPGVSVTNSIPPDGVVITTSAVLPESLDYNGHMNVAYYIAAFDIGIDDLKAVYGIDGRYIENKQRSTVALEAHITYQNEASLGDALEVRTRILDFDTKRTHLYQEMYRGEDLLATQETLSISFDLGARKSCPFEPAIANNIERLWQAQDSLPRPDWVGRSVGIRKKKPNS